MTRIPPPFPNAVCWDPMRRARVLNPIALDVPLPVFRATHNPSLILRAGTAADSAVAVEETRVLEEFLAQSETHVFTAAVGDTGTGKSHFIRWLHLEILRRASSDGIERHVVPIPRSAANLAEVVRLILQDFDGEATARLRAEVERHRGLREPEARQRVLDELAIAIENMAPRDEEDEEDLYLRDKLPAFLRDHEIRRALTHARDGIVQRLARHVLGQRESADPENLRWAAGDLRLEVQVIEKAGDAASEMASALLNDDHLCHRAAVMLQHAVGPAIAALLRFRAGDLKRALAEIREQLAAQNKELVLLLEDLSITEGLDGELLEALQVRTTDSGVRLCTLRSIVGLTREDYQRLRDNIKGRLTRTYLFDAPIGEGTLASEEAALALFAARYLNAVRLDAGVLDDWSEAAEGGQAPSACDTCPNQRSCHEAFGAQDGYGLYPLTPIALGRLYRRVVRPDGSVRPFKPRSVLKILSDVLDEGEQGLMRGEFPTNSLVKAFGLGNTTAELQLALRNELGVEGDRALRVIEFYAEKPAVARPYIPPGVATALGVRLPVWSSVASPPVPPQHPPRDLTPTPPDALDDFDEWCQGRTPSDSNVNSWRQAVHDAMVAAIDWDIEGIPYFHSLFPARSIRIEGQTTHVADPILMVARTPEAAIALRVLSERAFQGDSATTLLCVARAQIERWANEIRRQLESRGRPDSKVDALEIGIELLGVGAFLHGFSSRSAAHGPLLNACLDSDWDKISASDRGAAWNALVRAYEKHGKKVQTIVQHALSCTKGAQRGPFLDPSSVLGTLQYLKRGGLPPFAYDADMKWGVFRDVGLLAREVHQHLAAALEEERNAVQTWRSAIGPHLGEDSPADVISWIAEALGAAADAGLGDGALLQQISALQGQALKGCLDAADKALAASEETARLVALGGIDRPLMKELGDVVESAARVLEDREQRLRKRLQDAHGGKTPAELLEDIQDQLGLLDEAYAELAGKESIDV